jgi:hypothetical protein
VRAICIAVLAVAAMVVAASVTACGGDESRPMALLFGTPEGPIVEYDLDSNTATTWIAAPENSNTYLKDPAVSPDGSRVVFVWMPPITGRNGKPDASHDLWIAGRDGSNQRAAYTHREGNETLSFPQWEDDTHVLVVARTVPDISRIDGMAFKLLRINVDDGSASTVLDAVTAFGINGEGELAFARVGSEAGKGKETLEVGAPDASEVLLDNAQPLAFFNYPRFSDDGERLAFFAHDRAAVFTPKPLDANAPSLLQIMDIEDGTLELITEFDAREASPPGIAWADDGKHIYVAGDAGVFNVDIEENFAEKLNTTPVRALGQVTLTTALDRDE